MPSPFPGMNPYLEHPDRWPTVHNRLIVGLANLLAPCLLPKYQVDIDKRVYEVAGLDTSAPRRVTLPMLEEVREPYLEVRDTQTQAKVTTEF